MGFNLGFKGLKGVKVPLFARPISVCYEATEQSLRLIGFWHHLVFVLCREAVQDSRY